MSKDDRDFDEPTQRIDPDELDETQLHDERTTQRIDPAGLEDFPTRRYDPATPIAHEHTEVIPAPIDTRESRAVALASLMVIAALVGAAVLGYVTRVPQPPGTVARELVGPGGGVIRFDGRGRVAIPRGALATATTITIRRVKLEQKVTVTKPDGGRVEIQPGEVPLYTFEPNGLTFAGAVTIAIPSDPDADAVMVISNGQVRVVPGKSEGNTVVITTQSFSF